MCHYKSCLIRTNKTLRQVRLYSCMACQWKMITMLTGTGCKNALKINGVLNTLFDPHWCHIPVV